MPALAQLRAAPPHDVDVVLQHLHAHADAPAVGLELGFAGAPRADAAAEPRQLGAAAHEAGQQVLELRQFHLQLALARARAAREDVEDELRAVDDLAPEPLGQLTELGGRQFVVEDDQVGVGLGRRRGQHLDLAAAEERRGVGPRAFLQDAHDDARAGGLGQAAEFLEGMFRIDPPRAAGDESDQRCSLDERGTPYLHGSSEF